MLASYKEHFYRVLLLCLHHLPLTTIAISSNF